MSLEKYLASLKDSIINLDFNTVVEAAQEAVSAGVEPQIAIMEWTTPQERRN